MARAIVRSSQLVRTKLSLSIVYSNVWAADEFYNVYMNFCLLLCAILRLSNLQVTLALCLLLNFWTTETLCSKYILCVWVSDYFPPHHMPFLSTVL